MNDEVIYDLTEEPKARKMIPVKLLIMMLLMSMIGACLYIVANVNRLVPIEIAKTEAFHQSSIRFPIKQETGQEIPMKFVSGTEAVKEKKFYTSVLLKLPIDLIDNKTLVDRMIEQVGIEIEDGFDDFTSGEKHAVVEIFPHKKVEDGIIEVLYLVEFEKGTSTFNDFAYTIVSQFSRSVDRYHDLLNKFYKNGKFGTESTEYGYQTTNESAESEHDGLVPRSEVTEM